MTNPTKYRANGAIGALLDEYEKAIHELISTIQELTQEELQHIVDLKTDDEDCRSIQSILTHVVQSGYTYVIEIKKWLGEKVDYEAKNTLKTAEAYELALRHMFQYTEAFFNAHAALQLTELNVDQKINVRWGQTYDVEQLMEHAIVHILRHRRQIEIFKVSIQSPQCG